MWNLKYNTNQHIYKTKIDSDIENRLMAAKVGGRGGNESLGLAEANIYIGWIYIGWINDKVLLYSTGNYYIFNIL